MNKKTLSLTIIFMFFTVFANAQIKKAYRKLAKNDYKSALSIFNSDDYVNKSEGRYGTAVIFNKPDYKWDYSEYKQNNKNEFRILYKNKGKRYEPYYKLTSYKNILKAEKLYPKCNKRIIRKLQKYFSKEKIINLKNELEKYFISLDNQDILIIYDSLKVFCKGNLSDKMDNKYIIAKFEKIKLNKKRYIYKKVLSKIEELAKKFPHRNNSKILIRYVDSINYDMLYEVCGIAHILNRYPNTSYKNKIYKKLDDINSSMKVGMKYKKIFVVNKMSTKEEAVKKQLELSSGYNPFYCYEQTEKEIEESKIPEKFLIYTLPNLAQNKDPVDILKNRLSKYKNAFCYNLLTKVQIYSRNKIIQKGKLLNEYKLIVLFGRADYYENEREVEDNLTVYEINLGEKCGYTIIKKFNYYAVNIQIKDNPYPKKVNFKQYLPVSKYTDRAMYVIFFMNGKEPKALEIGEANSNSENYILTNAKKYFEEK